MSYWVRYRDKEKGPYHIIAIWHFFLLLTGTILTKLHSPMMNKHNGSEKKTGLNLKQKSDPNRNPSQFPIIFLRSTSYFLLLLYLFLGRYRVNKSELRFCTSHVTPFMRFIESRLSWLAGFFPSEHLVFCNHILLAFSRTHFVAVSSQIHNEK